LERVRHLEDKEVRVVVIGTEDFFDYFEAQNGRKRIRVTAKAGDTLKNVGRRYGMTVGSMERVNRRSASEPVTPGETLIVYAPHTALAAKTAAKTADTGELQPLPALPESAESTAGGAEETAETAEAAGER
jgi:LysM repeat protein